MNPISVAIEIIGLQPLAQKCGKSYQAVRKWEKNGLPRTEWTGETNYADTIEKVTQGQVTRDALLDWTRRARKAA